MATGSIEISVKGRAVQVPYLQMGARTLIVSGRWPRLVRIRDEDWLPGHTVEDPEACLEKIRQERLKADIFTFAQKLPDTTRRYPYPVEWDNVAALPTTDFSHWWEKRLPQVTRKNVRRAARRGLVIRELPFSDSLVQAILVINNETPIRQGRPFWHYGKNFETVKRDYATFLDRSEFICACQDDRLVGFLKLVYMGDIAGILQILCMNQHSDKRPANALIARAVEMCSARGIKYLTYGKYVYGGNTDSPLTEFKRRNGFEPILLPRYYIPLSSRGRILFRLGFHHGLKGFLPEDLVRYAARMRLKWYRRSACRELQES